MNNISWPFSSVGTCDFESMISVNTGSVSSAGTGVSIGQTITGASLITGQVLWNATTDPTTGYDTFFSGGISLADHGKFAARMQNGQWYCWDLHSGQIVWRSELTSWPFGVFGAYDVETAYGLIFANDYVGVHAINWTNGNIEWSFRAPTPYQFETPYQGYYPFHGSGKVADGKLYTFSVEHTPSQPITRGDRLYCLNATTGECIWNITQSQSIGGSRAFQGAIADGYLAHTNTYDAYLYVYGKGKSKTTVEVAPATIAKDNQVLIKGTVLDLSPAQSGTPCVAKDSMSTQMEYLHMQAPINGVWHNATIEGVPVILTAIASDGSVVDIGMVTTNGYYGTFTKEWTPPSEGTYEIIASFAGDDSYGSSGASTAVSVGPATEPIDFPQSPTPADYTMLIVGGVIAIIIAVIISVAVAVLILRKR
jgi:outer membrane protein assembly factor BamB